MRLSIDMLDILIRGGMVIDGTSAPRSRQDVVIQGDRIADIGWFQDAQARLIVDASGHVVAPGFVDMHSHADLTLPINPTADSLVHQGITTAVIGQCGDSPAPLLPDTRAQVIASLESEELPLPWHEWATFQEYLGYLTRIGVSVNLVPLVGHGTVRNGVMGIVAQPPDDRQMQSLHREVIKAMDAGAIGLSTGLIYPPGSYATTEELIEFTRPVGRRHGFYFSHIRNESDTLLEAIAEAIWIGRATGAAVQISHLKASGRENWDKLARALELIDRAREEGLDVTADIYSYSASSTGLAALLPQWAHAGGQEATMRRLADRDTRRQMEADMQSTGDFRISDWQQVMISSSPRKQEYEGRFVAELAAQAGQSPYEWIFDALLETRARLRMILFRMSEDNVRLALSHPAVMIGTDGTGLAARGQLSQGIPHPRSYGTFPRVLARYVREQGVISLEDAIWKMSGLPARKLGWSDRGQIKKGFRADLVVFHPEQITDLATFQAPHQYPEGIPHVIVNGKVVIHCGRHTQSRPGELLN